MDGRLLLQSVVQSRVVRPCSYGLDCKFKGHTAAANAAYANAPSTYQTQAQPVTRGVAQANPQQPNTNLAAGDEDRYKNMGDEVRTCNCIGCDGCKANGCTNKFELPASQKAWLKQRGMFFTTRCSEVGMNQEVALHLALAQGQFLDKYLPLMSKMMILRQTVVKYVKRVVNNCALRSSVGNAASAMVVTVAQI